jgi:digeranylgeranylglycerophospholipid reductase
MAHIHVVGAGPSGSIAALSALRAGHSVHVSEEHPSAGVPENCSGLFSRDGLESLGGFIDYRDFVIRPMRGADIHVAGETLSVRKKDAVGFVCDRASMDAALAARAGEEGAEVSYGERVDGRFLSDNIIGADGPLSSVARHFRFPRIQSYAATLQAMVPFKAADPDIVEVFISKSMFPGFFGWVIPHDEYAAEFGVGVLMPQRAQPAWHKLMRLKGVGKAPVPRGHVIPLSVRPRTAKRAGRRNVLLVGDAAGQVKSTTGGGVIFGGNCAAIAGRHPTDPAAYERAWRMAHGPDLALHRMAHRYLASLSDAQLSAFGRKLKKLNFDGYLSNHGHMDRPTRMIRPQLLAHVLRNII